MIGLTPCQEHIAQRKRDEPDPWYPVTEGGSEARSDDYFAWAKEQCIERCPLLEQCLIDGLAEDHGVWGGMSPRDRRKLRKTMAA